MGDIDQMRSPFHRFSLSPFPSSLLPNIPQIILDKLVLLDKEARRA
jgi:hypothetical protein